MKILIVVFNFSLMVLFASSALAKEDARLYLMGKQAARKANYDFAFMHYNSIVRDYKNSKYYESSFFARGEYFVQIKDYNAAKNILTKYLKEFPDSEIKTYALLYLYKIALEQQDAPMQENPAPSTRLPVTGVWRAPARHQAAPS